MPEAPFPGPIIAILPCEGGLTVRVWTPPSGLWRASGEPSEPMDAAKALQLACALSRSTGGVAIIPAILLEGFAP